MRLNGARALVAALLLALGGLAVRAASPEPVTVQPDLTALPYRIARWQGTDAQGIDPDTARVLAADALLTRTYRAADGPPVGLYIAYYAAQQPGVSIHSPLHCLPGTGWETLDVGTVALGTPASGRRATRLLVRKGLDQAVVLYWYAVHGRALASDFGARLRLLGDGLRLHRTDAALVRVVAPVEESAPAAERRGLAFARELLPRLSQVWSGR